MINNGYDQIPIPYNIDSKIESGVQMAIKEKTLNKKKNNKKIAGVIAASTALLITLGISNPVIAAKIPFVGSVFEAIEQNILFPGNYSDFATSVNEKVTSNGISMTLSDILCDGQSLYVTYIVESEKPFNSEKIYPTAHLYARESYTKVDFTHSELIGSSLVGKTVDDNTFIGYVKYEFNYPEEIPDEFTYEVNYDYISDDSGLSKNGHWAFKVPVKVNKSLRTIINVANVQNDFVKISSITKTPFETIINMDFDYEEWDDAYKFSVYDDKGNSIITDHYGAKNNDFPKEGKLVFSALSEDRPELRIVVDRIIREQTETITNPDGCTEVSRREVSRKTIFDQTIKLIEN